MEITVSAIPEQTKITLPSTISMQERRNRGESLENHWENKGFSMLPRLVPRAPQIPLGGAVMVIRKYAITLTENNDSRNEGEPGKT